MEVWSGLTDEQRLAVFIAAGSALLGGSLSLFSSWVVTRQGFKHQERLRANEIREFATSMAQETFVKLLQYVNSVYSLKMAIDDQFDRARAEGLGDLEPVNKVQEIYAVETPLEAFKTKEIAFILHSKDADLLSDLLIFEKRVLSNVASILLYNEKRSELTVRLESGLIIAQDETGRVLNTELRDKEAVLANVRIAALQALLGEIMERLNRDVADGYKLLGRFQEAAIQEYGDLYPKLTFEVPKC